MDAGKRDVFYFYFGDLIETILTINPSLFRIMEDRNFAIVLDNAAYQFFKGQEISVFNFEKVANHP